MPKVRRTSKELYSEIVDSDNGDKEDCYEDPRIDLVSVDPILND